MAFAGSGSSGKFWGSQRGNIDEGVSDLSGETGEAVAKGYARISRIWEAGLSLFRSPTLKKRTLKGPEFRELPLCPCLRV